MQRRWCPVRGNTGRKCTRGGLAVAPSGSSGRRAGRMVQTRSNRRAVEREEAVSRIRTPIRERKTRSSRFETPSETITESQHEGQDIVEEPQIVQAELQPCPKQPTESSDKLELNDQCSESTIIENNAEKEKEKLTEMETHEIKLIEISDIDEEVKDGQLKGKGEDLDHKALSETLPVIDLRLSSDEDKDALDNSDGDVLEESSINVTSGPAVLSEPAAIPPITTESPLAEGSDLFVIDTQPGIDQGAKYYLDSSEKEDSGESGEEAGDIDDESDEEEKDDFIDEEEDDEDILKTKPSLIDLSSSIDPGLNLKELGGLYISFDADKQGPDSKAFKKLKEKKKKDDELLANSILTPEFEKQECVPPLKESVRQLKKKRREERAKTTGDGWYNMKAPDLTDELKNDLRALKMRAAINPKRFYKKNDRDGFPKYFQVGKVLDNPVDFYHSRVPKKQRKRTMVEELLADAEFRRYNKKKYQQIIAEKAALAAGKKIHKKKKFRK
uniref:deoxynucleotidyltransferase terminal-interacting protein 2 isoform X2 n=1 Tax=Pristiophorus japonicus TaxID=55135 RepID=UPI00398F8073